MRLPNNVLQLKVFHATQKHCTAWQELRFATLLAHALSAGLLAPGVEFRVCGLQVTGRGAGGLACGSEGEFGFSV